MAAVADAKTDQKTWSKGEEEIEVTYDFAEDGGATGALDLFTAGQAMMVKVAAKVDTAATSAGSATVEVGKSGDTAGAVSQTGKASLTAGAVIDDGAGWYKLDSGETLIQTIATAALTAGKIRYHIRFRKF